VKCSTPVKAPKIKVKMEEVEERMVTEATVVKWRQAELK